jgi:hypothetical protein
LGQFNQGFLDARAEDQLANYKERAVSKAAKDNGESMSALVIAERQGIPNGWEIFFKDGLLITRWLRGNSQKGNKIRCRYLPFLSTNMLTEGAVGAHDQQREKRKSKEAGCDSKKML